MNVHPPKHVTCYMSHVTCHMWHVTCDVSPVTCHMSHVKKITFFFYIISRWRVCYQQGLPRLVFRALALVLVTGLLVIYLLIVFFSSSECFHQITLNGTGCVASLDPSSYLCISHKGLSNHLILISGQLKILKIDRLTCSSSVHRDPSRRPSWGKT